MIFYVKNLMKLTKRLLLLIIELSKVIAYKINIHIPIAYLHNNEQSKIDTKSYHLQ